MDPPPSSDASQPPSLASRMRTYEASTDHILPTNQLIILRLDGHGFSRFTSRFSRPFDPRIHTAMTRTSSDLLHFFPQATLAYTQSDEITLVFPSGVQTFNERLQKLCSLAASYCSVRFNRHLELALREMPDPPVKGDTELVFGTAHFDARFFPVPSVHEALNNLIWRCRNDAVRNAVSSFARTLYTPAELHGKKTGELIELMWRDKGVRYEEAVPKWAIEGCLVKREQYEHQGVNAKTGEVEKTFRTRPRVEERGVRVFDEAGLKLITDKYW